MLRLDVDAIATCQMLRRRRNGRIPRAADRRPVRWWLSKDMLLPQSRTGRTGVGGKRHSLTGCLFERTALIDVLASAPVTFTVV